MFIFLGKVSLYLRVILILLNWFTYITSTAILFYNNGTSSKHPKHYFTLNADLSMTKIIHIIEVLTSPLHIWKIWSIIVMEILIHIVGTTKSIRRRQFQVFSKKTMV